MGGERGRLHARLIGAHAWEKKHLFMFTERVEREERGDLFASKVAAECERNVSREQHTVRWAQHQIDWALNVKNS